MSDNTALKEPPAQPRAEDKAVAKSEEKAPIAMGSRGLQFTQLQDLYRFAQYVVASGFAPKGMERPESVVVAVQMGLEVGLPPMTAVQNIAVINGRPAIWGDVAKGLVEASGLCEFVDEWPEGEGDQRKWICETRRRGRTKPVRREFSVSDAKRAGLWGKSGPWTQYPERMLQMRARGFALRDAFPDVLKGLYSAEEARDIPRDFIDVTPASEAAARPRTLDEAALRMESESVDPQTGEILSDPEPEKDPEPDPQPAPTKVVRPAARVTRPTTKAAPVPSTGQADIV